MEEEDLKCGLCLDFFMIPVRSTKCGHNYCQQCLIQLAEASNAILICPECRTEQGQVPGELTRNFFLERILDIFLKKTQSSRKKLCETHGSQQKLRKWFKNIQKSLGSINTVLIIINSYFFQF